MALNASLRYNTAGRYAVNASGTEKFTGHISMQVLLDLQRACTFACCFICGQSFYRLSTAETVTECRIYANISDFVFPKRFTYFRTSADSGEGLPNFESEVI